MSNALTLPQYDPGRKSEREAYLQKMRREYAYTLTYNGNIATINKVPKRENNGIYYQLHLLAKALGLIPSLPELLWKYLKFHLMGQSFKKFDDYIFFPRTPFPDPQFREDFWHDFNFGRQRVAGANPVMIQGVNAKNPLPDTFRVREVTLPLSAQTFDQALVDHRLYMLRYDILKTVVENPGIVHGHKQYMTSPIALFYLEDDGHLRPLAIQMDVTDNTGPSNPIVTPADNQQWKLARTCVQVADGFVHELWTHAVQIHYVMESIIMASYRQLGRRHPLLALLDPHLQYTIAVNAHDLYQPDKNGKAPWYSKMIGTNNKTLIEFMGDAMRAFSFSEQAFPNDIKNRHMENPKLNYPYRDDGWPMWNAIQEFAKVYVSIYYNNDRDVVNDYELQAWAHELGGDRESGNCGLGDFPTHFSTVSEVANTIGQIIFICTAHHSSVHFPQHQYAGFVPNMPLSLYQSPATPPEEYQSQKGLMRFFPHFKIALQQAFLYYFVDFKVSRIGQYYLGAFDEPGRAVIKKHQKKLEQIAAEHRQKYRRNDLRYPFMDPTHIPNGVTA